MLNWIVRNRTVRSFNRVFECVYNIYVKTGFEFK